MATTHNPSDAVANERARAVVRCGPPGGSMATRLIHMPNDSASTMLPILT